MNEASKKSEGPTLPGFDARISSPGLRDGTSPSNLQDGPKTRKSGPEAAPASPSPLPAKAKASRTKGTCGQISFGSSPSAVLQQSLESKLRARLDVDGSPEYALTWKHWDTESDAPICALRASARRISGNGFTGWPTAQAHDPNLRGNTMADNHHFPHDLPNAADLTGWPTASVFLAAGNPEKVKARREECKERHGNNGFGLNLEQAAQILAGYHTPDVPNGGRQPKGGMSPTGMTPDGKKRQVGLEQDARLYGWATTTRDSKADGKDGPNRTGSPSLPAQALGMISELFLVPTGRRVVLAPEFSLWLMGFPEAWVTAAPGAKDWREAQAILALECSKVQETQ